jgi:20S proteasome alpha/beta subunit
MSLLLPFILCQKKMETIIKAYSWTMVVSAGICGQLWELVGIAIWAMVVQRLHKYSAITYISISLFTRLIQRIIQCTHKTRQLITSLSVAGLLEDPPAYFLST